MPSRSRTAAGESRYSAIYAAELTLEGVCRAIRGGLAHRVNTDARGWLVAPPAISVYDRSRVNGLVKGFVRSCSFDVEACSFL
jgi:hypothetical protein